MQLYIELCKVDYKWLRVFPIGGPLEANMAERINSKVHVAGLVQEEAGHAKLLFVSMCIRPGDPLEHLLSKDSRTLQIHFWLTLPLTIPNDVTET